MLVKFNLDDDVWELLEAKAARPGDTIRDLINLYVTDSVDPLVNVVSADEASKLWGLSPAYIKNLCAEGQVRAVKIGKTWVIDINQPNPKKELLPNESK